MYKGRIVPLPLSKQIIRMKEFFPQFSCNWIKNEVVWVGELQPTPLSQKYTIRIKYSLNKVKPVIWVVAPKLIKREANTSIPHTYLKGDLCLYLLRKKEWTKQKYIAETIIPWTSLWLYYYELWLVTGEWLGGGEHPIIRTKKRNRKQKRNNRT